MKEGYMKRMKVLWVNLHPELSYFNGKYLRKQSTYITQRGYTSMKHKQIMIKNLMKLHNYRKR